MATGNSIEARDRLCKTKIQPWQVKNLLENNNNKNWDAVSLSLLLTFLGLNLSFSIFLKEFFLSLSLPLSLYSLSDVNEIL